MVAGIREADVGNPLPNFKGFSSALGRFQHDCSMLLFAAYSPVTLAFVLDIPYFVDRKVA